jgi:hypothetical protein
VRIIKTKLVDTRFEWSAPLVWTQSGKMQIGSVTISPRDASANKDERKAQWLDALSDRLTDQINRTLTPLIDINKIVPAEFAEKHPVIDSVALIDQDGYLAAKVKWTATVPKTEDSQTNR